MSERTHAETEQRTSTARAWWGAGVLTLVYVIALADRQILSLLVVPVKQDLGIDDREIALLHGLAFAIFYTFLGIPLGVLADRTSRRGLIAAGLGVWSVMTFLCGRTTSFAQLFLARMGVGCGEATLSPSAYSWMAASFPRERLATALGVYTTGLYLGSGLSLVLGGSVIAFVERGGASEVPLLAAARPWQVPFLVLGVLGVACVPLLWTLREPARAAPVERARSTWREYFALVRAHPRAFAGHHIGLACLSFSAYAVNFLTPTVLRTQLGWTSAQAGIRYGIVLGVAGTLGALAGGAWADRERARGRRDANVAAVRLAALGTLPFAFLFPHATSVATSITWLALLSFFTGAGFGAGPAAVQELVPAELRGRASAVYLFAVNLVGALGPYAVALVARAWFGEASAPALALVASGAGVLAALACLWGSAAYSRAVTNP